ncbi:unnamed protein product, partial [Rotaria magnacalcarata]
MVQNPRSNKLTLRSGMNSCMIISDLSQESYMIIQDHTENHTKNRRLCDLMSDLTADFVYDPT